MNSERPTLPPENPSGKSPQTNQIPLDEIIASRRTATAQMQEQYGEAMSKEARCKEIGEALLSKATTDPVGENYLGKFLRRKDFPEATNECLFQYESQRRLKNPDFDITNMSAKKLARILERKISLGDKSAIAEATEQSAQNYESRVTELSRQGKSTTEMLEILVNDPSAPQSEKTKLKAFLKIVSLAQTAEDHHLITQKVNGLEFSKLPDPVLFIQNQIFDIPDRKSGFSEAFQANIAKAYNIPRMRTSTVTDMDNGLRTTRTEIDSKTGKHREVPIHNSEETAARLRDGVIGWNENGQSVMKNTRTGLTVPLHTGVGAVGYTRSTLNFWGSQVALLDKGVETVWGWNLRNQNMPQPNQLRNFERYEQLLEGGSRGLHPEVQRDTEQSNFSRKYLFIAQQGNTSSNASNQGQIDQSLSNIGIKTDGSVNIGSEEILSEIGNWLNTNTNASGQSAYDALQNHLHVLFPEAVNATTGGKPNWSSA